LYQDIDSLNEVEGRLKDNEDFIFKHLSLEEKKAKLEKKLEATKYTKRSRRRTTKACIKKVIL